MKFKRLIPHWSTARMGCSRTCPKTPPSTPLYILFPHCLRCSISSINRPAPLSTAQLFLDHSHLSVCDLGQSIHCLPHNPLVFGHRYLTLWPLMASKYLISALSRQFPMQYCSPCFPVTSTTFSLKFCTFSILNGVHSPTGSEVINLSLFPVHFG